jgi:alpha-tubulin suppressor-like RCC1 family protein
LSERPGSPRSRRNGLAAVAARPLCFDLFLALAVLAAGAGCLGESRFHCDDHRQCARGEERGFCEASGVCSFADESCELGRRYARFADGAGKLGGQCVDPAPCLGTPVVEVRAGGDHACYRRLDGRLDCWGRNDRGQLGDGTFAPRSVPAPILGFPGPVRGFALGTDASCAIDQDGRVFCWGEGPGLLGEGRASAPARSPVGVPGVSGALELALGADFACARTLEGVVCWGGNQEGQLGRGDRSELGGPAPVALSAPAEQIIAGRGHACARLRDGTVSCWGDGRLGQLGTGDALARPQPTTVVTAAEAQAGVVEIAAGGAHTCARRRDGGLICWGDNSAGQLGAGAPPAVLSPTPLAGLPLVGKVRLGDRHTCVVLGDESVACFGDGRGGRLGAVASPVNPYTPVAGVHDVLELAAGIGFSCALQRDTTVRCWGEDGHGQLGAGGVVWRAQPSAIPVVAGAQAVAAGANATCVVRASEVSCFGAGAGVLGEVREDQSGPVPVRIPAGVVEVAVGAVGACARTLDRTIWCWGRNAGPLPTLRSGITAADQVSHGRAHVCVRSRGRVLCWGENQAGQLGQAAHEGFGEPGVVPVVSAAVEIATGDDHSCARDEQGVVFCWGRGDQGQLGDGRAVTSALPVAVPLAAPAVALTAGAAHSCAVLADRRLWCWGRGAEGQLAGEARAASPTPVAVAALGDVDETVAGSTFTCVRSAGRVSCFGAGPARAAAADDFTSAGPREVPFPEATSAIAAGGDHVCAVAVSGAVRCLGLDSRGQLGTGRPLFSARPRPVAVACR